MVTFSDCKINIGLDIVSKRADGYHDICTCMVHVPWHDILEVVPAEGDETTLTVLGNTVDCLPADNLVMKAYRALAAEHSLPPVDIILQKIIPDGAGLGGGSADAAYTLRLLNDYFGLDLDAGEIARIASHIGADCPFFAYDTTMIAEGIGERLTPFHLDLQGYTLALVKPLGVNISTRQAYAGVRPQKPEVHLSELLALPVDEWQGRVKNDFEEGIFRLAPEIGEIKRTMLGEGASYASMSGSGASVYGLFKGRTAAEAAVQIYKEYPSLVHTY